VKRDFPLVISGMVENARLAKGSGGQQEKQSGAAFHRNRWLEMR
jgi:hypothetical protein